jgi:LuxR family quorum sensing-dependent transcriptional regulator
MKKQTPIPLQHFKENLANTNSIEELNRALSAYLASFDIKTYSFTYYSYYPNSLNKIKYDYATKSFNLWHKHYLAEHYEEIDSTLDEVHQTVLPTFWSLAEQLKSAKNPREKKMRLDSIKFGSECGLAIPIHGPQEEFAILLPVQMRGETCLQNHQEFQHLLFVAAYYYFNELQRYLLHNKSKKNQLNSREIQCLKLLAKQYSTQAIAKTLKITPRTVHYHVQRLNKKLGTKNKYQSVIKALKAQLIVI